MSKKFCDVANQSVGQFVLPALPYAKNALEPFYSEKLINLHYGKHHQTYVTNLNNMIASSEYEAMDLEEIIIASYKDKKLPFFNNAAQIWNHTFFWHCMKSGGGGLPLEKTMEFINRDFGSFDNFKAEFSSSAVKVFGSGWCWLVLNNNKLQIVQSSNAHSPIVDGQSPLLTIDVWEHAYYPDYENRRAEFIEKFFSNLVNWSFVENMLTRI